MTMKKYINLLCLLALTLNAQAQEANAVEANPASEASAATPAETRKDTAQIDRTVYVTRDFQPTVESAGKISVKPQVYEPQLALPSPQYSDYSVPLALDYTMNKLDFSVLNFRKPRTLGGYLEAGVGHANSLLKFNYCFSDAMMQQKTAQKKRSTANDLLLNVYALHSAQWGYKALSESMIGIDLNKLFPKLEFYLGANGQHAFFSRYGHYYDPATEMVPEERQRLNLIDPQYKQQVGMANARFGFKNVPGADVAFLAQVGYEAFIMPEVATEHQIHTIGGFEWKRNFHHVGAELEMQNRFYSSDSMVLKANHAFHIEPFYAYEGRQWNIHAGVNLDFSAGRGRVVGISPNVLFEATLAKNWLALYAEAKGDYAAHGARGEYEENRYISSTCLFADSLSGEYTPVNAELGFKIRPYNTLLINIHAGYALTLDRHVNVFQQIAGERFGMFEHVLQNVGTWRVGADLHFHYRDYVTVNIGGNYFIHNELKQSPLLATPEVFDMPSWKLDIRIDGKINEKWSLYSYNHLMGGIAVCNQVSEDMTLSPDLRYQTARLQPMFDLNLGVKYSVDKWLSVYAQLNNYLAWTPKMTYYTFYGYEAMGANCMFGLSYSF